MEQVIDNAEVLIIGNPEKKFKAALENINSNTKIVDLVGFMESVSDEAKHGICW